MKVLRNFYFLRAGVAALWVAVVLAAAQASLAAPLMLTLLVLYPAWDAYANVLDARRNGGLEANPGQRLNALVSTLAAILLAVAFLIRGTNGAILVFGAWALLAGIFQLAVGIRRRTLGGQVFMMISGAQSALAGVVMCIRAFGEGRTIAELAPYAAFGAFYFLLSGLWLTFRATRPAASA